MDERPAARCHNEVVPMGFYEDGFVLLTGVLDPAGCEVFGRLAATLGPSSAGTRCLLTHPACADLAVKLRGLPAVASLLESGLVAVQCTYFEKSVARNWLVAVHQDLSIPVAERVENSELRGWSSKEGELFVQGPLPVLERMVAVRVHLDPCREEDGPLRVVPGTHRRGLIEPEDAARARVDEVPCLAGPGDALLMRPLLLHSSSKATGTSRRRVLHFLFGPPQLPYGLRWSRAV